MILYTVRFLVAPFCGREVIRHIVSCCLLCVRILNKLLSEPKSELCFIYVKGDVVEKIHMDSVVYCFRLTELGMP